MAKNEKEFIALVERYESITLEEILEHTPEVKGGLNLAKRVTGFGSNSCTLCKPCEKYVKERSWWDDSAKCKFCVYYRREEYFGCVDETYDDIIDARSPEELLSAYRARAKALREEFKDLFI